ILAAAGPAWFAFSDSSARARSNSLPTSLASCPTASLKSSGIDRLLCEFIAIPCVIMRPVNASPRIAAATRHMRVRTFDVACRTFQEPHDAEAGQHGHSEKCGRLPSRKGLGPSHKIFKVPGPDCIGHAFDLRRRLPDISAGDRKVAIELPGRPTNR